MTSSGDCVGRGFEARKQSTDRRVALRACAMAASVGRVGLLGAMLGGAGIVPGCEVPRTAVIVRVQSEVPWGEGQAMQSVVLEVRRGGAEGALRSLRTIGLGTQPGRSSLPLRIGVLETSDDLVTPLWVEALGCAGPNGCTRTDAVVAQRALVRFVARSTMELPLLLATACVGASCATSQRCELTTGMCRAAEEAVTVPWTGIEDAAVPRMERQSAFDIEAEGCALARFCDERAAFAGMARWLVENDLDCTWDDLELRAPRP